MLQRPTCDGSILGVKAWSLYHIRFRTLASAGIDPEELVLTAKRDEAIAEFCRFYLERRAQEVQAAGEDERKRKKLEEEFTPRLEMTLVAIEGRLNRQLDSTSHIRWTASHMTAPLP